MFFTFTKRKIAVIGTFFVAIILGAGLSFYINDRYKLTQASDVYLRRIVEDVSYWWTNKAFGREDPHFVNSGSGGAARSIPVLIYHGLPDEGGGDNPFSPVWFSEHMSTLARAGWQTITLREFERFIRGDLELPAKSFLLTFDDGRKDTYYPSDPILRDLGMNAVMFAISKRSISPTNEQSPYYLSSYELSVMEKSDEWEVESHGRDSHDWYYIDSEGAIGHYFSNRLWLPDEGRIETEEEFRDRVRYDLANSKSDFEKTLNKEISTFAFPFGDYGQDGTNHPNAVNTVREEASKYYRMVFYQVWERNGETFNYPSPNEVMMRRIEPHSEWSGEYLLTKLESGLSKDLPYSATTFGEEWVSNWGELSRGEEMVVAASDDTTGGATSLNGSWWWGDHALSADVEWLAGSNVVLIGRRWDDENYMGCNFGRGNIYVKTVNNGQSYNIAGTSYSPPPYNQETNLGIQISGNTVRCLVNGRIVLETTNVSQRLGNGGIGLEVWDARDGVASAAISNLEAVGLTN